MVNILIKYFFRLVHITSESLYFAIILGDYALKERVSTQISKANHILLGLAFLLSGLINMIILIVDNKYKKDKNTTIWKYLLFIKIGLFLFLTPLFDKFLGPLIGITEQSTHNSIKLTLILLGILVSCFTKNFRETYLIKTTGSNSNNNSIDGNLVKNE